MNKILPLSWDSDFFNLRIGKLSFDTEINSIDEPIDIESYDLVYLFSKNPLNSIYSSTLVDTKVLFSTDKFVSRPTNNNIELFESEIIPHELEDLAFQSGHYSRFKLDEQIGEESFKKLYTKWLQKSITKEIADYVYVYKNNETIIGFITLKIDFEKNTGIIGLLATDSSFRGKGVGKELMNQVFATCKEHDIAKIHVYTQLNNTDACLFYEKQGFSIISTEYIYHLWK